MKIMVITIGTGGHIMPSLEVAKRLEELGIEVILLARSGTIESTILQKLTFKKFTIRALGFAGKDIARKITALWVLIGSVYRLNIYMKTEKIDSVFGSGGFGMVPAILTALWRRIPFTLLEMNRQPGLVVRLFSRFAKITYLAFPLAIPVKGKTMVTGVPIRKEFSKTNYNPASKKVMFLGGSQGARRLNELAVRLADVYPDIPVRIITGLRDLPWFKSQVANKNIDVIGFTEEPWSYLKDVALAVSRSGSSTIYELLTVGIPMILVPFPHATHDHQLANSQYLEKNGAALIITEDKLTLESLSQAISRILTNKHLLRQMHLRAQALALRNTGQLIAAHICRSHHVG